MGQTLGKIGAFSLTMEGIGLAAAFLVFLIFYMIWSQDAKKRGGKKPAIGRWLNAAGFGLFPAIAVWKAFEDRSAPGLGRPVEVPFSVLPFVTQDGKWLPCRIEGILALTAFFGICVWLIIRKKELPGNGDLLLIVLCLWGGVRSVTESFRESVLLFPGFTEIIALCMMLLPLICWEIRRTRQQKAVLQAVLDCGGGVVCGAILWIVSQGILSVGSEIGNLAVRFGCATLLCMIALLAGKDSRH